MYNYIIDLTGNILQKRNLDIHLTQLQELSEEQRERVRKFREDCTKETKVNPELIDRADRGDFSDDRNLKCFAKCFYLKAGFINDAAELQLDVIKSKIPKEANRERALEIIEKCKDVKGSDPCETAYAIHRCYFNSTRSIARKEDS